MWTAFVAIALADVVGEVIARLTRTAIPGPVIGMFLVLAALLVARRAPPEIERASDFLTRHLSLFFVPAAVGVMDQVGVLRRDAAPIAAALVVSTLVGLVTSALVFSALLRRSRGS
ncbi:CidA/LrgA family protein [Polyangium aurulentum]|uniref:CidA/LrgA family protein n=1 Tax=Polyangium aurulentum TaxID=2567896 RepID=UPI00146E3E6F|nr:CidA/LrgA family protein [Polyangium aurulentum]UQA55858.1 CidA/LrgA family protein [Polyangium aurulentum]